MSSALWPRRAFLATVSAATASVLLTACGGATATGPSGDGTPVDGGNLTFLIQGYDTGWVSSKTSISSYEGNLWGQITDKLVYVDEKGKLSPWIAESWEELNGAKEFVLHLKKGVTFSDGSPLDAAAVVANLNAWAKGDPSRGVSKVGLFPSTNFLKAEAKDAGTVRVTFSSPALGFIATLGYHGCILLSPKTLALPVEQQADLKQEIGSGPFVVKSWKQGDSYVLEKRKDYNWGPAALGHTGPARLDTITYKVIKDTSVRTSTVASGQAEVAFNVEPQEIDSLKAQGFTVGTPRYLGFTDGFQVNTGTFPTNELSVRQAIQHGIDREEILKTVYTGDWTAATTFLQGNVPEAGDYSGLFKFDPEAAKKLLEDDGWKTGADGYRVKDGKTLELTLSPNPYVPSTKAEDELISQQLKNIGIKVNLKVVDVAGYAAVQASHPPLYQTSRSFVDVGTVAGVLTSQNNGEDWFRLGTSDKKLNELSTAVATASDRDTRKKVAGEIQQHVLEQGYFIPLNQLVQRLYLISPKVQGVQYNGLAYANFYTAWIAK
ncbi:putative peptide ABC transporter peptide-binding protein [Arthrobacter globiformis NBRC 12137]|uniref:Putative peptide ABC transporter peptide-binding protein n=1 Tax=Arthrobacter globiformis (strain ATCC 8010 / DSM 20124 / JCM 1332 / NBRC 12137 / NCIMB 8907 / NRRL B-2979 / 168) TaxID=1077972 RepID=H0QJB7_ARTG1|nr:ABC transporter substrate-binding protein [Arthrobacter globiformis]GAB12918.1 putative peptide ABC transporter peptide-binding protein [Arthrobacter globiformis NBRC 12137]